MLLSIRSTVACCLFMIRIMWNWTPLLVLWWFATDRPHANLRMQVRCNADVRCRGIFYWHMQRRCYGLSDIGQPVPTSLNSESLAKQAAVSSFHLEHAGNIAANAAGPYLRFKLAFDIASRLFGKWAFQHYWRIPVACEKSWQRRYSTTFKSDVVQH